MRTRTSPRTPLTVPVSTRPSCSGTVTSTLVAGSTRYRCRRREQRLDLRPDLLERDATERGRRHVTAAPLGRAGVVEGDAVQRGLQQPVADGPAVEAAQLEGEPVVELRLVAGQGRAEPRPDERADGVLEGGRQVLEVELVGLRRVRAARRGCVGRVCPASGERRGEVEHVEAERSRAGPSLPGTKLRSSTVWSGWWTTWSRAVGPRGT